MKVMRNLCLSAVILALVAGGVQAQVAVNEVDYDNPGTDASEFVELVGRAGTVLDGWTLRGINANMGTVYADYVLQGTIPYDFDSVWGGKGGFFVIGQFDAETVARANAINTGTYADVNPNQGVGTGKVAANTAPDFTPTNWTNPQGKIENGSFGAGAGDILQLWKGTPGASDLVDEWYYDYDPGYTETGLSEGIDSYDSAGTNTGVGADISSIGRYGYSYGTPILVFDKTPGMDGLDLFDLEPNDGKTWTYTGASTFTSDNYLGSYGPFTISPGGSFTEHASAKEVRWSGTDGYNSKPAGPTPGTFNNVDFGEGSQDVFTINLKLDSHVIIPGDANDDGSVNELDAQIVAGHWGNSTGNGTFDGDFNSDGYVNALDASILAANWGYHSGGEATASVPEPGVFVLAAIGLVALMQRRMGR